MGIVCHANLGVEPEERSRRQPVRIDLDIGLDVSEVAAHDDPAQSFDYREVLDSVEEVVGAGSFRLIETLAEAVAEALVAEFRLREIVVRAGKPEAARELGLDGIEVEVIRERGDVE
jgi:dihydroneopterin aldolase